MTATPKILSMYQFVKGKITERHFYAQASDDDVYEATDAPPTVTTGTFSTGGAVVLTGSASSLPASWANVNDQLLFTNGVDLPKIYPGLTAPVDKFIVYRGTSFPAVPEIGNDYTDEVTDGDASTVAVLDALGAPAAYDCIFVMTPIQINTLTFTVSTGSSVASAATVNYWTGSGWTTAGAVTDTTKGTNTTLSTNGTWVWTIVTSSHVPSYMFGANGYWYQLTVSVALSATTRVSAVSYTAPWQSIANVWDGTPVPIVESLLYNSITGTYSVYGSSAIDIGGATSAGDLLYVGTTDPAAAIFIDVGDTPISAGQAIATLKYWNGSAWAAVTGLEDGTTGFSKSGWLTFAHQSDISKYRMTSSTFYIYWYQITIPQSSAVVCLNFDGSDAATATTDLSEKTWTFVGTAQLDTAQYKWTSSLLLDGNSDYIYTPAHSDFNFGTGDFTVEWWGRVPSAFNHVPLSLYVDADNYFYVNVSNNTSVGVITLVNRIAGTTTINYSSANFTAAVDTWYHFAIVRKNGTIQAFADGVGLALLVATASIFYDGATAYRVGNRTVTTYAGGWIDDLRICRLAVYPLGANFTPPASAVGLAVSGPLPATMTVSIDVAPYFDITEIGKGQTVCAWKERAVIGTNQDHYCYLSAQGQPQVLNGSDSTILAPGDGRFNPPVAMRKFKDNLLIWQQEKGQEGGCLTKYIWNSTVDNIEKSLISNVLGAMNAKSVDVIDGVEFAELNRDIPVMTVAFFLSRLGVFVTDGNVCYCISKDIANYFDPTQSACILVGYESDMWLKYDSAYGVIRIGLVSGSLATVPNVFPVYDVKDKSWSFDVLTQELSCMTEAEAGSGSVPVVQLGGGVDDGTVYVLNSGTNDVTTAIDAYVTHEIDGSGNILNMEELLLRAKVQSAGNITVTPSLNSIAQTAMTLSQTAEIATQTIRRHRVNTNLTGQHISLKIQHNTASESCQLLDIGTAIEVYEEQ